MIMNKQITLIVLYIIFSTLAPAASSEPVFSEKGMVVSTSRQASEAGIEILKKGGNAIDASVATGFVLAVTSSSNGNIGGGGFMVSHMSDGTTFTLDYREIAPAAAHRDMYLDANGEVNALDDIQQQAAEVLLGGGVSRALDLSQEDAKTLALYDTSRYVRGKKWNSVTAVVFTSLPAAHSGVVNI